MKVAIIYPTNRLHMLERSYNSRHNLSPLNYCFCIIGQDPVLYIDLKPRERTRFRIVNPPIVPGLLDMVEWYHIGMNMGWDAEYYLFLDDDHYFQSENMVHPSSGYYYQECIDYMDANRDVGFMITRGHHPLESDDTIVKNPTNGLISMGRGMIMRNVPEFQFTELERSFQGSMVESLLCYKMMELGYNFAKRFGCPTLKEPSKKVGTGGISYSHKTLEENIVGYIRRRYDDLTWEHESKKYPKGLLELRKKNKVKV